METPVRIEDLKTSADTIRTNTRPKSNTAALVGTHLNMINQMLEPMFAILQHFNDKGQYIEVACSVVSKGELSAFVGNEGGNGEDGNQTAEGTTVSWNQKLNSGTIIAEITINGNTISVYAPTPSGNSNVETKPSYKLSEIEGAPSASKMNAWDDAANKRHSHNNLTNVLERLTVNHLNMLINLCKYASFDSYGNITFEGNVIGKKEGEFFGNGTSAGGSGSTGGGESGGQGSGGGYEDGGSTGGDTGGGTTDGETYTAYFQYYSDGYIDVFPMQTSKSPNALMADGKDGFTYFGYWIGSSLSNCQNKWMESSNNPHGTSRTVTDWGTSRTVLFWYKKN